MTASSRKNGAHRGRIMQQKFQLILPKIFYCVKTFNCYTSSCHSYNIKLQDSWHRRHDCKGIVQEKGKCYVQQGPKWLLARAKCVRFKYIKPSFHMSGKSHTIEDFTVSRQSQDFLTNAGKLDIGDIFDRLE